VVVGKARYFRCQSVNGKLQEIRMDGEAWQKLDGLSIVLLKKKEKNLFNVQGGWWNEWMCLEGRSGRK